MGAVKARNHTKTKLVPFVITNKYKLFRKSIKIEFLEHKEISDDLEKNDNLRETIRKKIDFVLKNNDILCCKLKGCTGRN